MKIIGFEKCILDNGEMSNECAYLNEFGKYQVNKDIALRTYAKLDKYPESKIYQNNKVKTDFLLLPETQFTYKHHKYMGLVRGKVISNSLYVEKMCYQKKRWYQSIFPVTKVMYSDHFAFEYAYKRHFELNKEEKSKMITMETHINEYNDYFEYFNENE